jgi:protein-tyrosine phosphatase
MEFVATEINTESFENKKYKIILPKISQISRETHAGPLPESNKVFEGFYAGAFPGDHNDEYNDENLITLLNSGFDTFVCMMTEYHPEALERQWRNSENHLVVRPYMNDIKRILENKDQFPSLLDPVPQDIIFKHIPIKDMKTIRDADTLHAALEVVDLLKSGKKIYLHCWGGHGRTGVIVCLVLHLFCGLTAEQAFIYCQHVHDLRENNCFGTESPQTNLQREQVKRIIRSLQ